MLSSIKRSKHPIQPSKLSTLLTALAAFLCYTSMYAFRKSITAAEFEGTHFFGIDYKIALITIQMLGYMLSKFYGIRFISESNNKGRGRSLIVLIVISWLGLLGFASAPSPWNALFLFVNGFPLGMVWGLVFSYLEGRRQTEFMGAVMAISLIFASGLVKTVGRCLLAVSSISEYWMPFFTGMLFFLPFVGCVYLLEVLPPPDARDRQLRTPRIPMDSQSRKAFLRRFMPGIALTVTIYTLLTMIRDIRDNFEVEIWKKLHITDTGIYAKVDGSIAVIVLLAISLLIFIENNRLAFRLIHLQIFADFAVAALSGYLLHRHAISGTGWMTLTGLGLYMAYIPYNAIFFERLIATFRINGNIGFMMYLADAIGYLGSFIILLNKELLPQHISWADYFIQIVFWGSSIGAALSLLSYIYFERKKKKLPNRASAAAFDTENTRIQLL